MLWCYDDDDDDDDGDGDGNGDGDGDDDDDDDDEVMINIVSVDERPGWKMFQNIPPGQGRALYGWGAAAIVTKHKANFTCLRCLIFL